MIQRRQTLFLLLMILFNLLLLFVPVAEFTYNNEVLPIHLAPIQGPEALSSVGHYGAIVINFSGILLGFAVIFLYKKRKLQVRLTYLLVLMWLVLGLMIAFCPFVTKGDSVSNVENNYLTTSLAAMAILSGLMAVRLIKKDIELLRSADRIR